MTDVLHTLTWEELCADPSLQDPPYRIEFNGLNQIVMSPFTFGTVAAREKSTPG